MSKRYKKIKCELCSKKVSKYNECEHSENGYCGIFILQAEVDKATFNMRDPINKQTI